MLARTDSRARALLLLVITAMLATLVGGRLVFWQVVDRDRVAAIALNQLAQNEEIPAERGEIRDINGVLLATSVEVQSVYAIPPKIKASDPDRAATQLAAVLGMDAADVRDRLASKDPWVWLRRRIDPQVAAMGYRAPHPRGRDAPRDAARLPDQRSRPRRRPSAPSCSASSTSTGLANTGSRAPRMRSWPGCPDR